MESGGGLYRRGSSISATLQQERHPSLSFYRNRDNISDTVNIADGPRVGAHRDSRGLDGHVSMGHTIEDRLDEMMRMLSGTQQLLLDQQSTTKRLESSVEKLNADVDTLRSDLKVFDRDSCASGNKSKNRVPSELRVSTTLSIFSLTDDLNYSRML